MHAVVHQVLRQAEILTAMGLVFVASWAFVAWTTLGMSHPAVPVDDAGRCRMGLGYGGCRFLSCGAA